MIAIRSRGADARELSKRCDVGRREDGIAILRDMPDLCGYRRVHIRELETGVGQDVSRVFGFIVRAVRDH